MRGSTACALPCTTSAADGPASWRAAASLRQRTALTTSSTSSSTCRAQCAAVVVHYSLMACVWLWSTGVLAQCVGTRERQRSRWCDQLPGYHTLVLLPGRIRQRWCRHCATSGGAHGQGLSAHRPMAQSKLHHVVPAGMMQARSVSGVLGEDVALDMLGGMRMRDDVQAAYQWNPLLAWSEQ